MGSICIKPKTPVTEIRGMRVRKPEPWDYPEEITRSQLLELRNKFWINAASSGGRPRIWRVLRRAAEAPLPTAQALVDRAGIIPHVGDLSVCFDDRCRKYELPLFVLSEPRNLRDG